MANERFGTPRTSVTAAMLQTQRYMDKNVRLIGSIVKNSSDSVEVNTGENVSVTVRFQSPLDEPLEGIIDVQGRLVSRSVVEADSYIILPPELTANFDLEMHSQAVTFIASSENPWTQD